MTVQDVLDKMDGFTDDERQNYLLKLINSLSPVSHSSIRNFQNAWDGEHRPFEEFKMAQNKVIRECIELELSEVGKDVRKTCGLPELTLFMEV